jgi:hypothetical protein
VRDDSAAALPGNERDVISDLLEAIVAVVTWPFRAVGRLVSAIFGRA